MHPQQTHVGDRWDQLHREGASLEVFRDQWFELVVHELPNGVTNHLFLVAQQSVEFIEVRKVCHTGKYVRIRSAAAIPTGDL